MKRLRNGAAFDIMGMLQLMLLLGSRGPGLWIGAGCPVYFQEHSSTPYAVQRHYRSCVCRTDEY